MERITKTSHDGFSTVIYRSKDGIYSLRVHLNANAASSLRRAKGKVTQLAVRCKSIFPLLSVQGTIASMQLGEVAEAQVSLQDQHNMADFVQSLQTYLGEINGTI